MSSESIGLAGQISRLNLDPEIKKQSNITDLKKLIVQKETRENAESLIRCLSNQSLEKEIYVKQAKYFLLGYLISCSPKQILDDLFMPIYFLAKYMMLAYFEMSKNPSHVETFKWCLDRYLKSYAKWEEDDREKLASELLIQYYDIENTIDEINQLAEVNEPKTEIKQHLENNREKIRSRLYQISSDYLIAKWNQEVKKGQFTKRQIIYYIKSTTLTGFEYYGDPTEIIGKQAFWDYFEDTLQNAHQLQSKLISGYVPSQEDLASADQAHQLIYSTIEEFKKMMKNLVPHRLDLANFYDENLNTEYIKHLVDGQIFKSENLNQLVKYSMEQLQNLGSEQDSADIVRWLQRWEIIQSCPYEMSEVLPYVLRDIINKTERITGIKNLMTGSHDDSNQNQENKSHDS